MSNCYLKRLTVSPGRMQPTFDRSHLEYTVVLGTQEAKTILEVTAEVSTDGHKIFVQNEEQNDHVFINEGCSKIVEVIVTSEFKEISRIYTLHITRISSKAAFLEDISIQPGKLVPSFNRHKHEYTCNLGSNISYVKFNFVLPDRRCSILINKEEPRSLYDLNVGDTYFVIKVLSVDESQSKKYMIDVQRKPILRYVLITDPIKRFKFEDPISLSPLYCPRRILDFNIWPVISSPILHQLQRLNRLYYGRGLFEPASFTILKDPENDKKVSDLNGKFPFTYGGLSNESKLSNIGAVVHKCNEPSPFKPHRPNNKSHFTYKFDLIPEWQNDLERKTDEEEEYNISDLDESILEYLFYLPSTIRENYTLQLEADNAMKKLIEIISTVTKMIKKNVMNINLHFLLALLLEEKFIIEDTLNIKSELFKRTDSVAYEISSPNQTIINEICKKVGFIKTPTLSQQLRSLQDEQSYYRSKSLEKEADHIQILYEWKSREDSVDGKMAFLVNDKRNVLGKAAIKYSTALQLDQNSAIKNFQVARMMMLEGRFGDVIIRLETALTLNPDHSPSKFLLGLAYANLTKLTDQKIDKSIELLLDGMEKAINIFSNFSILGESEMRKLSKTLKAEDSNFFRLENPLICRGIFALAKLLLKKGYENTYIKPVHAFHSALHIASLGWSKLSSGCIMAQFEYVIIACHEELFHILNDEIYDVPTEVIIKRCEWLNALISSSMLPSTQRFIDIQEQICRVLVFHQPCNEYYLINLGMVIFKKADMYPFKHIKFTEYISHAIRTFKAAIETNDKPMIGLADAYLEGLSWFKIHKLNYLTKKAPIFICESLQSIENDEPGFLTRRNTTLKKVTKKSRRKNAPKVYREITSDKFESSSGKTKKSASVHFIPKKINANFKCNQYHMYKNDVCCLNLHKILTPKQLSSNKTSLFQSCRKYSDERDDVHYPKKESLSLTIMINPPTHYSRLMLGRSFRANHQYTESLKCFNYIRKMTTFVTLKATVNREMIECLLECENFDQVLDFIGKVHIMESKISYEDILLSIEIIRSLIRMSRFEDEKLEKYCLIVAKHEGLDYIEEILLIKF